uniref:NACHT domain-containing protein n=1 Tax=Macrostomum lignano TaxID=282301 RepID=A0A1I8HSJ9_9PLAT
MKRLARPPKTNPKAPQLRSPNGNPARRFKAAAVMAPMFISEEQSRENLYRRLLCGNLDELPKKDTKSIRIFISSTFSDMAVERNALMKTVYSKMKEFYRDQYGLEFQIVDMRWGIQDAASSDHKASEMCFNEILNCQRLSSGPHFMTILSHRYGGKEAPNRLTEEEAGILEAAMSDRPDDLALLHRWYLRDENGRPPVYNLRPLESEAEQTDWPHDGPALQKALEVAANAAVAKGSMTSAGAIRFCTSITHQEIQMGVLDAHPELKPFAFAIFRDITDIQQRLDEGDKAAQRFADPEAAEALDGLRSRLRDLLPKGVTEYSLTWQPPKGISPEVHADYLDSVVKDFEMQVRRLVDTFRQRRSELQADPLYAEVLQHAHHCVRYVTNFQGRKEFLDQLRDYTTGDSRQPLLLCGSSGCGKTSIMAKAAKSARSWLPPDNQPSALLLLRFLGTSPSTSSIRQTVKQLCQQLAVFLGSTEAQQVAGMDSFQELVSTFYDFLQQLGKSRRVIIVLDSLDQLDASDYAYQLTWLRSELPPGCKMILSCLPTLHGIRENFLQLLPDRVMDVPPLEPALCEEITRARLEKSKRRLTEPQWDALRTAFASCSLPIYIGLVFRQARRWSSYTPLDKTVLEPTVEGAIRLLLSQLGTRYGEVLVRNALSYVTASRTGLSEAEIEDLLSLDDDVLREVFTHHLPPFIRVPPLAWTRIRQQIDDYLVEREADGVTVLFWYHRQFWEVAQKLYLSDPEHNRIIHSRMADYFFGEWAAGREKPFECPERVKAKLERDGLPVPMAADRQVPAQPFVLRVESDKPYYNLRRINQLPRHFIRSGRVVDFLEHVAFNLDHLQSKLASSRRHQLLMDLHLFFDLKKKERGSEQNELDLTRIYNALRISAYSLSHSPLSLPVDLCGRLQPFAARSRRISDLLEACKKDSPLLLPVNNCLDTGSGYTHCTVQVRLSIGNLCEDGKIYAVSLQNNTVTWYDHEGSELKTVVSERPAASHIRFVAVLPTSGCFCTVEEVAPGQFQLLRANMRTGAWKVLMPSLPDSLPLQYFAKSGSGCLEATEGHMIFAKTFYATMPITYCLLKSEPLRHFLFRSWPMQLGQSLINDRCLFYIGHRISEGEETSDEPLTPRVVDLDTFEETELDCSGQGLAAHELTSENTSFFDDGECLFLVTLSPGGALFTFYLFDLDPKVERRARHELELEAAVNKPFMTSLSRTASVAVVMLSEPLGDCVGFLWYPEAARTVPVAYHRVLDKSYELDTNAEIHTVLNCPVHISDDGSLLLVKAKAYFTFNVWSAKDGSFLLALRGVSDYIMLGQPYGTDYLVINTMPEAGANASTVQLKVFNLNKLAGQLSEFESNFVTKKEERRADFVFDPREQALWSGYFDKRLQGGVMYCTDLGGTGARDAKLREPLPDGKVDGYDAEVLAAMSRFKEAWNSKLNQLCNFPDLQQHGLFLRLLPRYLLFVMRLASQPTAPVSFEVPESLQLPPEKDRSRSMRTLRDLLGNPDLHLAIVSHPAVRPFPVGYFMHGCDQPWLPATPPSVSAAIDGPRMHLLVRGPGNLQAPRLSDVLDGRSTESPDLSDYLLCLDLPGRKVQRIKTWPVPTVGDEFVGQARREVALQVFAEARQVCQYLVNSGKEKVHQYLPILQQFIETLTARCRASVAFHMSNGAILRELESYLGEDMSAESLLHELDVDLSISVVIESSHTCRPRLLHMRPGRPGQLVLQLMSGSVNTYREAFRRNCMAWPGRLMVVDASSYKTLSLSRTFDAGVLYLLPDGMHCVTYRLKIFNIETGLLVKDLKPDQSIILYEMVLSPDSELLVGKLYKPARRIKITSGDNSGLDEFVDPPKTVQAYRVADGQQVFNYLFETEPFMLLVPSAKYMAILLRYHPVQLYRIPPGSASAKDTLARLTADQSVGTAKLADGEAATATDADYLRRLNDILTTALTEVANKRPSDPIEYLSRCLMQLSAQAAASLQTS